MSNQDCGLATRLLLEQALDETAVLLVRAPDRLPGIVGLVLVLPLHLQGYDEVWSRIGVRLTLRTELDVAWHLGWMVFGSTVEQGEESNPSESLNCSFFA